MVYVPKVVTVGDSERLSNRQSKGLIWQMVAKIQLDKKHLVSQCVVEYRIASEAFTPGVCRIAADTIQQHCVDRI